MVGFQMFFQFTIPVFVFPDAEPLHEVLGALEFGVQTVLLTFEPRHVLHGDAIDIENTDRDRLADAD